jgi:hypothetical protein
MVNSQFRIKTTILRNPRTNHIVCRENIEEFTGANGQQPAKGITRQPICSGTYTIGSNSGVL